MRRGALAALVTVGLVLACACGASAAVPDRVPLAELTPLPPAGQVKVSPAARDLRARLLGPRAADPRYVTLHWVGVSSFLVTVKGHLFLFDAWEIVGAHEDYLPLGREELAGLEPEAVLIGHGHFDHAADAGYVAGRTGAVVLASQEQCDTVKEDAARDGNERAFTCAITGNQDSPPFGNLTTARLFGDLPPVTLLKNVHSATRPPGNGNEPDPFVPVLDPTPYLQNPNTSPEELARFLETLGDDEGGTRMYHLRVGDFSLLLGDSAGPIFEHAAVRRGLDGFPDCVDVMANAILGFDQPVSALQDPVDYVAAAHPRVFLPTHADAWAPALSAGQAAYREELTGELAQLDNPPELDFLLDPRDYLAERAYRVDARRWKQPMAGSSCARGATRKRAEEPERRSAARRDEDTPSAVNDGASSNGGAAATPAAAANDGDLPFTGLDLRAIALAGLGLLALGAGLRRRLGS